MAAAECPDHRLPSALPCWLLPLCTIAQSEANVGVRGPYVKKQQKIRRNPFRPIMDRDSRFTRQCQTASEGA